MLAASNPMLLPRNLYCPSSAVFIVITELPFESFAPFAVWLAASRLYYEGVSYTLADTTRLPSFQAFESELVIPIPLQWSRRKIRRHVLSNPRLSCECRRSRKRSNGKPCLRDEHPGLPRACRRLASRRRVGMYKAQLISYKRAHFF